MPIEMRNHTRYRLRGRAFATLSFPGHLFLRIGEILDVSEGGLALNTENGEWPEALCETDLIGCGTQSDSHNDQPENKPGKMLIERLPSRVVYRRLIDTGSLKGFKANRCGIQFRELSTE